LAQIQDGQITILVGTYKGKYAEHLNVKVCTSD